MNAAKSLGKNQDRLVFRLSHPAIMKFRPQKIEDQSASLMDKMKTFSKLIPFRGSR